MVVKNELAVITKAKDLCSYVITVTDKSPKRFRSTLVSKLQNYGLNALENMYNANEVFVRKNDTRKIEERSEYQRKAMTELKLLGYISQLAMEQGCILPKQYEQITKRIYDCQNMLGAWINGSGRDIQFISSFMSTNFLCQLL